MTIKCNHTIELSTFNEAHSLIMNEIEKLEYDEGYRCSIIIRSGNFSGSSPSFLMDKESFETFLDKIKKMNNNLEGEACLRYRMEPEWVCFEMTKMGHLYISGEFYDLGEIEQHLDFKFKEDQTCLPSLIECFENVYSYFNIR